MQSTIVFVRVAMSLQGDEIQAFVAEICTFENSFLFFPNCHGIVKGRVAFTTITNDMQVAKPKRLDGTSGRQYYYSNQEHRQRHAHHFHLKKQGGGGKIQVWGCITCFGIGDLEWLDGSIKADHYLDVLRHYVPSSHDLYGMDRQKFIFQYDNSSVHIATIVKHHLSRTAIKVLPWLVNSPDLNPIECVWGYIDPHLNNYPTPASDIDEFFTCLSDMAGFAQRLASRAVRGASKEDAHVDQGRRTAFSSR